MKCCCCLVVYSTEEFYILGFRYIADRCKAFRTYLCVKQLTHFAVFSATDANFFHRCRWQYCNIFLRSEEKHLNNMPFKCIKINRDFSSHSLDSAIRHGIKREYPNDHSVMRSIFFLPLCICSFKCVRKGQSLVSVIKKHFYSRIAACFMTKVLN